jgi:hypothetical protein
MRTQALEDFCSWIEQTPLSIAIQGNAWVVPTVQTIHILAVAAVLISVLLINLRLLGFLEREQSLAEVVQRFAPFIWLALPCLLITGSLLIIGEPARSLANDVFQVKMLLLLGVIVLQLRVGGRVKSDPYFFDATHGHAAQAMVLAVLSLSMWVGIVCAGRWIAYTYS